METVKLASPEDTGLVRRWAEGIQAAITEHLMEQLQASTTLEAPKFSGQPGGHGWNEDET